jgi:organic hydroperoxide reductase OsmC/OhrA
VPERESRQGRSLSAGPIPAAHGQSTVHAFPHVYVAAAGGRPEGAVSLTSKGLPDIDTAAPPEFGGPGGVWSPETLLCASLADCFVLSFRAIARASKVEWSELACRVEGVLERVDGVTQFTRYTTFASLKVPSEEAGEKARRLLEKAEHVCLVSNSLRGERTLVTEVVVGS